MKLAYIAEPVSKAGLHAFKTAAKKYKEDRSIDLMLVQGDSFTNGYGLGKNHSLYIRKLGADFVIGGDQIFYKKDLVETFQTMHFIIRPANLPFGSPGRGWRSFTYGDQKLAIISLLGQSGFRRSVANNPFRTGLDLVEKVAKDHKIIIVDFHALTTAEKQSMFTALDGKVQLIIGSGTGVQSADLQVSPKGTGFITDIGRSGAMNSVGGFDPVQEIKAFRQGVPNRSADTWSDIRLNGLEVDINESGHIASMELFSLEIPAKEPHEANHDQ